LSAKLLIAAASVLGQKEDSIYYSVLLDKIQSALLRRYMPLPATETGYLLPLAFGLLPDSLRGGIVERLVKCVHEHDDMLSTGFLGTPCLLPVLTRYGHTDLAYKILMQEAPPSWLYPVKMGATTIWEKWDAISPDGKVGEKSLNHYAYGAVGDWLYRDVAGIMEEEAGYRRIRIAPHPGGGLSWVNAGYDCLYGRIVSNWKTEAGRFRLHVEIPENTSAEVYLPGGAAPVTVGSGRYDWDVAL
jgi:alpha-L-rhamnosidase